LAGENFGKFGKSALGCHNILVQILADLIKLMQYDEGIRENIIHQTLYQNLI